MDALLHNLSQVLCFLIAPIALALEIAFVTLLRRKRIRSARTTAKTSHYTHPLQPAGKHS
jgi:hypothetical protein